MEHPSPEKRKKSKQNKPTTVNNDSSYGSMITGTSSSSSISLSLFSESDLAEAPSTSGCSSEMASAMQSKEKKKERAKEFMKKLKSMLPMKERTTKMDTLSTLEQLVNSMRQLNEEQKRDSEFKTPPPHSGSYHGNDADKLSQSNMYVSVSLKNHVVQMASASLMEHLGYPLDWWKGRLLKDFLNKKDINTVNSCIALHSTDEDHTEVSDTLASSSTGGGMKEGSKYFYARMRRFRKLGAGFNLQNVVSYCPFMMMITTRPLDQSDSSEDEGSRHRKSLMVYCHPLSSAYGDGGNLPEQRKFSLRHSPFCNYTYVHPNAVRLLGFLPQDFNGMSIFDLYHPDDFQQLLEIHKKIMLSMGQPFKSSSIRLRTRNGCYVEVETEWSSFINPWSMRLEFIIGQHTVIKGPSRPDLFEDLPAKPEKVELSPDSRRIQEKILEVLKKPIQGVFAEPSPVAQSVKEQSSPIQKTGTAQTGMREPETVAKVGVTDKAKGETGTGESKSTVIDDKGISSIYNQLNYSHNIKRFLMSHPKSFSNVSDEDSVMTRDDSEDEAINDEEEMPLEIPVVKPPSCGSSTQVHVSEQGHGEEMLSPPTFGDEAMPPRESADNIHCLTEETLKKHTKIQERLYLQRVSEEQPLLLNMRRIRSSRNTSHQKRPRVREAGEDMDTAKHPCTNSGVFRSSSNIFMQSFPTVTSSELTPATPTPQPMFHQSDRMEGAPFDNNFLGQNAQIGFQPFAPSYQTGNQGAITMPAQPTVHLVPGDTVPLQCIPTSLGPMLPNPGLIDMRRVTGAQNMQWPYYPQTGYTLLPQVMTGFYRPLLQPVQVQTIPPQQGGYINGSTGPPMFQEPIVETENQVAQMAKKNKTDRFDKKNGDSDNPSSSVEDTTSSIMYLLEADSSTFEDSDNKASTGVVQPRLQNKRSLEPPWLRGVKWNAEIKMRYTMPQRKMFSVLKTDDKMLKKAQQSELVQTNLEQLLEDIALPDHEIPVDEEADYIFFPGDEVLDVNDKPNDKAEEVDITQSSNEVNDGGGGDRGGGGGSSEEVVWSLGACENEDENYDTPVNSHSEDEKAPPTPTQGGIKEEEKDIKRGGSPNSNSSKAAEESGDIAMETVFISNSQAGGNSALTKRGSSPKDGSLSGDEGSGSDGGQKAEMEDSQSNCSKVSSDLTPSDDRSNEEAGSSLKESDASMKNMKGVSSVASSNSSNDQTSQEEGPSATPTRDSEDVFRKLFVPLKVQVTQKLDTPAMPYWLVEAHLSHRVAMTYKVPSRQLEDVLSDDKKKMSSLVQSSIVKQQLLQLLSEVDMKSAAVVAATTMSASTTATVGSCSNVSLSPALHNTATQSSSADSVLETIKEETLGTDPVNECIKPIDDDKTMFVPLASSNQSNNVSMESLTEVSNTNNNNNITDAKGSLCKGTSQLILAKSPSVSMESLPGSQDNLSSPLRKQSTGENNSSDTNTDPIADEPLLRSSDLSHSSSTETTTLCENSSRSTGNSSRSDSHLQERFQAIESNSLSGQKIEDIIMSKVFLPAETSTNNPDTKNIPNMFNLPE
uniref:Period 2-like protein n=1 Tax=Onchidium reevesii TaxID=2547651 RepID=A0A514YLV5_9EUPU|nr:period 2-like protein [Onchidium reevesii]QEI10544.1 putative period circadian protein 2 [Onchidium reevesii]